MLPSHNRRWVALLLLSAVEFILLLDASIVNVALPTIKAALHFSETDLAWIPNLYQLVFGGFLLFGGRAADLFGRRRLFLAGLTVFTIGSLLAGLAPTPAALLAARFAQGVGAALVIPAEQSLLVTIFTDPAELNRAFGIWGAMGAAGGAAGLALGGILTQFVGWPWIFLINIPICAVALLFSPRLLPESRSADGGQRLDIPGALVVTVAILSLAYAPIAGQEQGWTSPLAAGSILLAVLLFLTFLVIEARSSSPLVPLRIFRIRNANGANTVSFLVGAAHAPMFYLLSLYLQQVLGYDALITGFALLPVAVVSLLFSVLVMPRVLGHLGSRRVLFGGMLLLAVGLALLARAPIPSSYALDILPALVIVAIGLPCAFVGTNIAAVTAVEQAETGLASGLMNTAQRVGSGIGIAVLTAVSVARISAFNAPTSHTALAAGFQAGFIGAALFAVLGALLTLLLIRQPKLAHSGAEADKDAAPAGAHAFHFHH